MAAGTWGGDNLTPQTPTQMSAWSKEFVGWLTATTLTGSNPDLELEPIETKPVAYKVQVSPTQYYLISNRQQTGFDANLPASGLLIMLINSDMVNPDGLRSNTVNSNRNKLAVRVVEADGGDGLVTSDLAGRDRGDEGNIVPGSASKTYLDSTTNPRAVGGFALCGARQSGQDMIATIETSGQTCSQLPVQASSQPAKALVEPSIVAMRASPMSYASKNINGILKSASSNYFADIEVHAPRPGWEIYSC